MGLPHARFRHFASLHSVHLRVGPVPGKPVFGNSPTPFATWQGFRKSRFQRLFRNLSPLRGNHYARPSYSLSLRMRPSVSLIEGRHITAADKRSILDGVEYLRSSFASVVRASADIVPNYKDIWLRRAGSSKRYSVDPCPDHVGRYRVIIREAYRDDYGTKRSREARVMVELRGIAPLHLPTWAATDLFAAEVVT